tara:strand:+ start:456 stop:896 length:441 start_codon:yes stop_codon:yes gene_type:complete
VIVEAVAAVSAACKALEMAAGAAQNIESLGAYIGKLGAAEFDLQRAKNSKNMSEAEAMKVVMAEETLRQSRENIKEIFLATNRMDLWNDMMTKQAEARKNRQAFLKSEAARKRKFRKEMTQYALIFLVVIVLVPAAVGALLAFLTR